MKVSRKLVKFVASFEGFSSCPYLDTIAQPPVWTIGYGDTNGVGPNTPCISKRKARKRLREDLNRKYVPAVPRQKNLKQCELDALTSFAYNVGVGAVSNTTFSTLARRLKSSEGISYKHRKHIYRQEIPKWDMAGGVHVPGLTRRRAAEVEMACNGDYSA